MLENVLIFVQYTKSCKYSKLKTISNPNFNEQTTISIYRATKWVTILPCNNMSLYSVIKLKACNQQTIDNKKKSRYENCEYKYLQLSACEKQVCILKTHNKVFTETIYISSFTFGK